MAECKLPVVKDASSIAKRRPADYDETGDGGTRGEIFKRAHGREAEATNYQISRKGSVDCHVVGNLKFAASQQDGVGDACGINRVAIVCVSQRLAQRAGSAVIGVCD